MYVLNIDETSNRILSAGIMPNPPEGALLVDVLPEGNISDYLLVEGEYVYDPAPETVPVETERTVRERFATLEEDSQELREALDLILSGVVE